LDVEPGYNFRDLGVRECGLGHAEVGAPIADHGSDEDAFLVIEDENRPEEVGGSGAAAGRDAVTAGAVGSKELVAALDGSRILAGAGECGGGSPSWRSRACGRLLGVDEGRHAKDEREIARGN
jgi:hypothetical protein